MSILTNLCENRSNGIDCGPINHILSIPYIYVFILDVTHVSSILFFLGLKQSFYYNVTAKKVFIGFQSEQDEFIPLHMWTQKEEEIHKPTEPHTHMHIPTHPHPHPHTHTHAHTKTHGSTPTTQASTAMHAHIHTQGHIHTHIHLINRGQIRYERQDKMISITNNRKVYANINVKTQQKLCARKINIQKSIADFCSKNKFLYEIFY